MDGNKIDLRSVSVPNGIDDKQAERAIQYVTGTVLEGLTISETLKKYSISSGTMYNEKHLKNPLFEKYIQKLTAECASTDEIEDYKLIAGKIKQNALKPNSTRQDYELYLKTYAWLQSFIEHEKMAELGIKKGGTINTKTPEERKAKLLQRLNTKNN